MNGFVTIATGNEKYYQLAANLLLSYRKAGNKMPFCLVCDRHNEYTKQFDRTIILEKPNNNYLDKFFLLKIVPYDNTIFLDADSLIYGKIDYLFSFFSCFNAFSTFGYDVTSNPKDGWFYPNELKEYSKLVKFVPSFHGGIMFFKKDNLLNKMYDICLDVAKNFQRYKFPYFKTAADEPCYAVAMAVLNLKPINAESPLIFTQYKAKYISIIKKRLIDKNGSIKQILHWGTDGTSFPLYKREARCLREKNKIDIFVVYFVYYANSFALYLKMKLIALCKRLFIV